MNIEKAWRKINGTEGKKECTTCGKYLDPKLLKQHSEDKHRISSY